MVADIWGLHFLKMGKHVRENHRSRIFRILALLFQILENSYRACILLINTVKAFLFQQICICAQIKFPSLHFAHKWGIPLIKWSGGNCMLVALWYEWQLQVIFRELRPFESHAYFVLVLPIHSTQQKKQKTSISNGEGRKRFITVLTLYFPKGNYNYQVPSWFL